LKISPLTCKVGNREVGMASLLACLERPGKIASLRTGKEKGVVRYWCTKPTTVHD
jgi:hypothetical protein